jgi:DNA-binding NarL/FixJ family response regulator
MGTLQQGAGSKVAGGAVRVLLVDDREIVRQGLESALATEPYIEVVGGAGSVPEALALAKQSSPTIIVAEMHVGECSAVDLIEGLRAAGSAARVVVLSGEANESQMRRAMSGGARGYLLKEDGYSELLEALRVVHAGRRYFSDSVESTILDQYADRVAARFAVAAAPITAREREVLARIGQGQSNKAIAKALRLSVKTIEKHRSNLMRKLGLHNTAAVTVYAMRQGLVNQQQIAGAGQ